MAFDINKFRNIKVAPRVSTIRLPQLAKFFEEEEAPIFKIRNLTGEELACCNEAVETNKAIRATIEKLMSKNAKKKAEAICESLGVSGNKAPDDIVRRINLLKFGCIEPELAHEDCVRLASIMPEAVYAVTNKILRLTAMGADLGELNSSGEVQILE